MLRSLQQLNKTYYIVTLVKKQIQKDKHTDGERDTSCILLDRYGGIHMRAIIMLIYRKMNQTNAKARIIMHM